MGSKPSILDELHTIQATKMRGARCSIGIHLNVMKADEKESFIAAMEDQFIDSTTISVWLDQKGYKVPRHTIARHRRKECQCR